MQALFFYNSPIGKYALQETDGMLTRIWLGDRISLVPQDIEIRETPLLQETSTQLRAYFAGQRKTFDLPLALVGTTFQLKVWKLLQDIPYGQTISYGELACRAGNPKACRAIGMTNSRNPLPIVIPCHRVIGANGKLTGYTGGLMIKIKLLEIEGCRAE